MTFVEHESNQDHRLLPSIPLESLLETNLEAFSETF